MRAALKRRRVLIRARARHTEQWPLLVSLLLNVGQSFSLCVSIKHGALLISPFVAASCSDLHHSHTKAHCGARKERSNLDVRVNLLVSVSIECCSAASKRRPALWPLDGHVLRSMRPLI